MTAPAATDAEVLRQFRDVGLTLEAPVTVPKTNGVRWSDVVRRIEAGEPVPRLAGEERLHPLAPPVERAHAEEIVAAAGLLAEQTRMPQHYVTDERGGVVRPPTDHADDRIPIEPVGCLHRQPAPPSRRGWLLRAIEGVFG